MPHWSEDAGRLPVRRLRRLPTSDQRDAAGWLLVSPICPLDEVRDFAGRLHAESVFAILTVPADAARIVDGLRDLLPLRLWVAVKHEEPRERGPRSLPEHHAALVLFSRSPLRHTKTRVAYTYCPACERTTKDYGGKKHTYHAYGTLLSDVWRDIAWTPGTY